MNQSKIDKSSHYLFGFIFVTLTIFSFFLTKEVSALRNTAPQVGNNDQICVGGYLYTITATNWRYQKQLQKYATYIDSSDIARGCLQEYVLNKKTGRYTLQCRHYDGTNTDMTFRVDNTQNRLSCKSSIDIDSSKFTNYEFTPNLSYQYQSCPISTSNVEVGHRDVRGLLAQNLRCRALCQRSMSAHHRVGFGGRCRIESARALYILWLFVRSNLPPGSHRHLSELSRYCFPSITQANALAVRRSASLK